MVIYLTFILSMFSTFLLCLTRWFLRHIFLFYFLFFLFLLFWISLYVVINYFILLILDFIPWECQRDDNSCVVSLRAERSQLMLPSTAWKLFRVGICLIWIWTVWVTICLSSIRDLKYEKGAIVCTFSVAIMKPALQRALSNWKKDSCAKRMSSI